MPDSPAKLRILATSDLHMHVVGHDYFNAKPAGGIGLESLVTVIARLRADAASEGRACLLLDNGDLLQGTLLGDHLAHKPGTSSPHPMAAAMNALRYDAVGVGNHDLDYGLPYLASFAQDLSAPILSSNLHLSATADWLAPTRIITAAGLRIGILSVLPERTMVWAHAILSGHATISPMRETVRQTARDLRIAGADVVIALAHTGIGAHADENALALIASDGDVDALIGGHTHHLFPNPTAQIDGADMEAGLLHAVPTVMPGYAGQVLGCIDLDLAPNGASWTRRTGHARLIAPDAADRPTQLPQLRPAHAATLDALEHAVGTTDTALTSYFAQLQPTRLLALAAAAQADAMERARHASEFADLPLLSMVSPPRAGGQGGPTNYTDIPPGPFRARHVSQLYVFSNLVWLVEVTGAELRLWLEKSASAFASPADRDEIGLLSPAIPAFDFDIAYGVSYEIDPTAPPMFDRTGAQLNPETSRIVDLRHGGTRIQPDDRFAVAVTSYRACGGGNFPGLSPTRKSLRSGISTARVMHDYVASGHTPSWQDPWRFSDTAKGLRTWIDTGPGAADHLGDIAAFDPGEPAPQSSGFLRVPITR